MDTKREKRKKEHIKHTLEGDSGPLKAGWEDVSLVHQALLNTNMKEIDTKITLFNKTLKMPLFINAMTGGAAGLEKINGALAQVTRELQIGLAVGSQTAAIYNPSLKETYEIVRKVNPQGLILANVSAWARPEYALAAV